MKYYGIQWNIELSWSWYNERRFLQNEHTKDLQKEINKEPLTNQEKCD